MISTTNALNQVASFVNDPGWGVVTQVTDANNHTTELQYDGYGRLQKVCSPPASLTSARARPLRWKCNP